MLLKHGRLILKLRFLTIAIIVASTTGLESGAAQESLPTAKEECDYLAQLAQGANPDAQLHLANCYIRGIGRDRDYREAEVWLRKSWEAGSAEAANNLAALILFKLEDDRRSEEAITLLHSAVDSGIANAGTSLGIAYLNGLGVLENECEAIEWFKHAAELNDVVSNFVLFGAYWYGDLGVEQDRNAARIYLQQFLAELKAYPEWYIQKYIDSLPSDQILSQLVFDSSRLTAMAKEVKQQLSEEYR